jgi:CPA2 family monovalent cation:H+ antiporter-2
MAHELIVLGVAFLLAAAVARAGGRFGLPTIPMFMVVGVLAGPHTPGLVLFEEPEDLELLAAFGLIFLLFYLGVELSLDDLAAGGRKLLGTASVYLAVNVSVGLAFGFALGWGTREAFVIAGATGISSSAIVTKVLVELRRLGNPETRLVLAMIVLEDVFLALYLAALAPALGQADSVIAGLGMFAAAAAFLVSLTLVARYGARVIERLVPREDELLTVSVFGVAMLLAGVALWLNISEAIGAFMGGLLFAGTNLARRVRRLVRPLRDGFAAIFFFAFGLSIDPADAASVAGPALAAVLTTVVVGLAAGGLVGRIQGLDRQAAANLGATMLARGEFSLILVSLGVGAGLDHRLSPMIALYVLVLAVLSPVMAAYSHLLVPVLPFAGRGDRAVSRDRGA